MPSEFSHLQIRLARQIADYVRAHSLPAGSHLSAQQLARELGVSRTPVRKALLLLMDKGIVRTERNRGFFLGRAAGEIEDFDLHRSEEESLYQQIAEDRLDRRVPCRFTESEYIRRYGVTRSALGRVLQRMSQEGLVRRNDGYGWKFLPIIDSVDAMARGYRFRVAIESAALLEPSFEIDRERFAKSRRSNLELLASAATRTPGTWMFEINAEFHEMLANASGNQFFLEAVRQQNRLRRLSEYRIFVRPERIAKSCRDHLAILDAIEDGHQQKAAEFMRRHLERGLENLKRPRDLPLRTGPVLDVGLSPPHRGFGVTAFMTRQCP